MFFNSVNFGIFLPVIFALYWFVTANNLRFQNILLLVSSYFFYACWDGRFLFLLIFSTLLDYCTGLKINSSVTQHKRRSWLWLSVIINLGFLGIFKYYNFFAASFAEAATGVGLHVHPQMLKIILPIGISFYTFHGLSYVIDIYYKRITAEKNFIEYAVFVSFFPLLVAGPIERATHLLPQIKVKRVFNRAMASNGLKQILWGLFKKIVIADNCAKFANIIFHNPTNYSGSTLVLGAIFFAFQIYGDFSGYSDIAIGTAKLFGINLLRNFAFPYFSRDMAEFWRRWHISLSSWFKDYLYIPLGGSKAGTWKKIRNTFIIFLVSGFWHGANWTFVAWGLLNAIFIMPSIIFNTNRKNIETVAQGKLLPTIKEFGQMCFTFMLTVFAWIFFRCDSITNAIIYTRHLFSRSLFTVPYFPGIGLALPAVALLLLFIIVEWRGRENQYAIENIFIQRSKALKISWYYVLALIIFLYTGSSQPFIYFQF